MASMRAAYLDPSEAGGRHHVFIKAEGRRRRARWQACASWSTGWAAARTRIRATPSPTRRVKGTIRSSSAWTWRRNGIVFATSADQPGDRADGMGLPNNEQVAFVLTFRRQD
ncbi:MAG: hypothetical protein R2838_07720 [Caldilineaceae bacterium]